MTFDEFKKLPLDEAWNYVDNAQVQRDDALARAAVSDALAKKVSDLETVLGGTEAGAKLLRQKQRDELVKKIADAQTAKDAAEKALGDIPPN